VRSHLPGAPAEYVDDIVLVASELVTNSIRYGTEPGDWFQVSLSDLSPSGCRVEVHDPVRRRPRPHPASQNAIEAGGEGS
jgi:hypothetical protein